MHNRTQTIRALTCRHSSESWEPWEGASVTPAWWPSLGGGGQECQPQLYKEEATLQSQQLPAGHSQTRPTCFCLDLL
jgi:hypothetical protein